MLQKHWSQIPSRPGVTRPSRAPLIDPGSRSTARIECECALSVDGTGPDKRPCNHCGNDGRRNCRKKGGRRRHTDNRFDDE
jgi:hypothetical protein